MTRVLVVGAGHNGLVAAIHLAARGCEVTVLEHAPRPGGATTSAEVSLPGFVHDHCAGFAPMSAASPAMRELELDVDWIAPPTAMAHPFPDGSAIALHREVRATAASLGAAGDGWVRAMDQLLPHAQTLASAGLARPPPGRAGARLGGGAGPPRLPPVRPGARRALALRRDGLEWGRRLLGSAEALGLELFDGDERAT